MNRSTTARAGGDGGHPQGLRSADQSRPRPTNSDMTAWAVWRMAAPQAPFFAMIAMRRATTPAAMALMAVWTPLETLSS
jgi:hypothetical protein